MNHNRLRGKRHLNCASISSLFNVNRMAIPHKETQLSRVDHRFVSCLQDIDDANIGRAVENVNIEHVQIDRGW